MNKLSDWLPTTNKEVKLRGWEELDVILFSGDAYVDHPAFVVPLIFYVWSRFSCIQCYDC